MSANLRAACGLLTLTLLVLPSCSIAEPASWPCRGKCFDAAILWNDGIALFFKDDKYWAYDLIYEKVDIGNYSPFPRPMRRLSGLPGGWSSGITTALNEGNGNVYFFKGSEYIRLDIVTNRVEAGPATIASLWPELPPPWSNGFDAAVNWRDGKVYFFKGAQYLGFDLATNKASEPRPISGNWHGLPDAWTNGIDTAVNWGNGKAFLFKGDQYVRYDIADNKVDSGFPRQIAADWAGLLPLIDWAPGPVTKMPRGAMKVGGEADGRDMFLCAAWAGNAIYPGKTWETARQCYYSDGTREQSADVFAVAATTLPIAWQAGPPPADRLIPVGRSSTGRPYYLCRARSAGAVYPGRFVDRAEGCTIALAGRSQTMREGMETAAAPTTVNSPYMPYTVKMLSPLAGSERFKNVCAAEVVYQFRDAVAGARIPRDLPEMRSMIQTSARNSCAMLYKDPAEVPKYARKIDVVIETNRENDVDGFVNRSASGSTITLQARMFPDPPPATPNILVTLIVHEITHTTQGLNNQYGAFTEGIADYVLIRLWERHDRKPGGTWLDGYGNAASFFIWLDTRYPDFVYRFNRLANRKPDVSTETFRSMTGKSIDELWREYQQYIVATRVRPEAHLQWARGGGRACELTVYYHDDFGGDSFHTTQDHKQLSGGWNDQISSIVIASGTWEFFEHDDFGGRMLKLGAGRYPRLVDGWNDQISSFHCIDRDPALHGWPSIGCEAKVYWDDKFEGDALHTTHDLMHLTGGWNDQISSIAITAGTWEFFEHDAYGGQVLKLGPGHYRGLDAWNDRISSFRCVAPTSFTAR
jgi:hypothetical protein